jgi:hypothetical protein
MAWARRAGVVVYRVYMPVRRARDSGESRVLRAAKYCMWAGELKDWRISLSTMAFKRVGANVVLGPSGWVSMTLPPEIHKKKLPISVES